MDIWNPHFHPGGHIQYLFYNYREHIIRYSYSNGKFNSYTISSAVSTTLINITVLFVDDLVHINNNGQLKYE